jgi:hypothetical protein
MGTWNAFYVGGKINDASVLAAIRESFPEAKISPGENYQGVTLSPEAFTPPENALSALSARLHTDVLWLSFQSTVDAFQFHHWRDGKHLRALGYGCYELERTWERVEGAAEPWERDVFFSQKDLQAALKFSEPREKKELQRIWQEGKIAVGATEPSLDASSCAHRVAGFFGLPGY